MDKITQVERMKEHVEEAVLGTVADMLKENMPGTGGRPVEELVEIVRRIHLETIDDYLNDRIAPAAAAKHEWRRIRQELTKTTQAQTE